MLSPEKHNKQTWIINGHCEHKYLLYHSPAQLSDMAVSVYINWSYQSNTLSFAHHSTNNVYSIANMNYTGEEMQ